MILRWCQVLKWRTSFWQDFRYFCSFFFCLLAGAETKAGLLSPVSTTPASVGRLTRGYLTLFWESALGFLSELSYARVKYTSLQCGRHYVSHGKPWENESAADERDRVCTPLSHPLSPTCCWTKPCWRRDTPTGGVLENGNHKLLHGHLGICKANENTQIRSPATNRTQWVVLKEIFLFQEGDTRSHCLVTADEKALACEARKWNTAKRGKAKSIGLSFLLPWETVQVLGALQLKGGKDAFLSTNHCWSIREEQGPRGQERGSAEIRRSCRVKGDAIPGHW